MKTQKARAKPASTRSTPKVGNGRLEKLERQVRSLTEQVKKLRESEIYIVPVETLYPEPFLLKRPFHVVVCEDDQDAVATFFDANLGMSGDNAEEAVRNLKAVIVDTFDQYEEYEAVLGPEPARQLAVLREFIQRQE